MNYYTLNETMPGITEATTVASVAVPALPALAGVKRGGVGGKKKGLQQRNPKAKAFGSPDFGVLSQNSYLSMRGFGISRPVRLPDQT